VRCAVAHTRPAQGGCALEAQTTMWDEGHNGHCATEMNEVAQHAPAPVQPCALRTLLRLGSRDTDRVAYSTFVMLGSGHLVAACMERAAASARNSTGLLA